ncbi:MAG: hypothetical protein PHZ04_00170 [Patescibacteria group bacterium]|nr:hypothetical protein [Patescibacteria group bacterium]
MEEGIKNRDTEVKDESNERERSNPEEESGEPMPEIEQIREIIDSVSERKQEGLSAETKEAMQRNIEEIENPETREKLLGLFTRIIGYDQEIEAEKHGEMMEISEETDIPPHLLEKALAASQSGTVEGLRAELLEKHREGEGKLENFIAKSKQPYNLLYIDKNISPEEIKERIAVLDELYKEFKGASLADRTRMEEVMVEMFGIPTIAEDVQNYLDEVAGQEATVKSEGAENKNSIFLGKELRPQVIKITKERHDVDFASVLKLMREMHAISLRLDHEQPEGGNVKTGIVFNDMTIYKDKEGNYKRMVRQDYAKGQTVKELPSEIKKDDPGFREAWKVFLRRLEAMKKTDGVVLDISDSDAGFKEARGNVINTGNVFVKLPTEENPEYFFSVIDPDVFDAVSGEHKFDALEHIRKARGKGLMALVKGTVEAIKIAATNQARDKVVSEWQNKYVKKELES